MKQLVYQLTGKTLILLLALLALLSPGQAWAADAAAPAKHSDQTAFRPIDVFGLEYASDPRISPDGERIVYVRNFMDIMKDRSRANLWTVNFDGSEHRPLTSGESNQRLPRWSPDGKRLLYVSSAGGSAQLYMRWMDSGQTAKLSQLQRSPASLSISPDGRWIAFTMLVGAKKEPLIKMPAKPKGAKWAAEFNVIDRVVYRYDGRGYLEEGYEQLFVLSAEGGTPRQITFGPYHHDGKLSWSADGGSLIFSANRHNDWELNPMNSDLYEVALADGAITQLTKRNGPDESPVVSPEGRTIAYLGFDDQEKSHQVQKLYVMNRAGGESRLLTGALDRSAANPIWAGDGRGLYFQYDDRGVSKIGYVSLGGQMTTIAKDVGGATLGRPYASGSFSVSQNGRVAFTKTRPDAPADVAVAVQEAEGVRRVTRLNDDLLAHKKLGQVEMIWYESSHDQRKIQAWIVKPANFDPAKKYPLILEIHGGPHASYGERFSAEMQLYAAAGYVVLYANPRGSTGYGQEFAQLIHHAYPGYDYDDLMSGVDEVIGKGYIDEDQLYVTGGSGGGVLSSWIVGKTDRFRAAVVVKPVINWYSFVLTSDVTNYFYKYWFPGFPWDHAEHYLQRSPLSLAGKVKTPTMLMTGEQDHRTPISQAEQFYQALKLRGVPTVLVRVPEASHSIASRPSHLISKTAHVLAWFEKYKKQPAEAKQEK